MYKESSYKLSLAGRSSEWFMSFQKLFAESESVGTVEYDDCISAEG